jgi:sigma-54 dependent transcriptional regulator, acetoin dehydrogenase operon transcriptional activator AcoR
LPRSDYIPTAEQQLWRDALALIAQTPDSLHAGVARLADLVREHLGVDRCDIFLLDPRLDELILQQLQDTDRPVRMKIGAGITGLAALQRQTLHVPQMAKDPRSVEIGDSPSFSSILAVPILSGVDLAGIVNLQTVATRHFEEQETIFVERVICPLVLLLVNAWRSHGDLKQRNSQIQALNELGQAMNSGLGLDESLELIASRAAETLSARGSAIRLLVSDGSLALATLFTLEEGKVDTTYEKRIAEFVAATGEPILIDDLRTDDRPGRLGSSLVSVPLVLEERVVGTLTLMDKMTTASGRRLFSDDDVSVLFALSSQIAAEIEDIRLTSRLQELVRSERQQGQQLRSLYNRSRALLESISDGLLAIDREGTILEANTVARRILGRRAEEIEGGLVSRFVDDNPPLSRWLERGEQFSSRVITLLCRDGKVAAMANLQPVYDEEQQPTGAVLTFREMGEVGRLVNRVIGVQRTFTFDDILGESPVIEKTKELARVAAGTASNILIQGETGTGKEVFAQAIHNASAFSEGPFLAINCAALPRDLIESELFGYVEGAFTGASRKGRLGKFELASGGTIFLDEIGEIPAEVQVKLLRVLQEKAIVRVGGDRTIPVDCRLIAATNRDLHRAVAEGVFRQDLLYRLDVISIDVPPVRERQGDLPIFVARFLETFAERNGKVIEGIAPEALARMEAYDWPGNVREVENVIEHAVAMTRQRWVTTEDMPPFRAVASGSSTATPPDLEATSVGLEGAVARHEAAQRAMYLEALKTSSGDINQAASLLGMSRATFYRHLRKHGLKSIVSRMRREAHN